MILETENILPHDYPIYLDYAYLVDQKVILSPIQGTVQDLKSYFLKQGKFVDEVRNCDIFKRMELAKSKTQ